MTPAALHAKFNALDTRIKELEAKVAQLSVAKPVKTKPVKED